MADTETQDPRPAAAPESPTDPYEFSGPANVLFTGLGTKMHFVGIVTIVLGGVAIGAGVLRRDVGPILAGVIYGVIGIWTARAGSQFRTIAWTHGHDLGHLMAALESLRRLYTLQYWLCLIALFAALLLLGGTALH
ncbi:MAG: hypothetical protein U0794_04450 [Isosphaeraceae bacterium]